MARHKQKKNYRQEEGNRVPILYCTKCNNPVVFLSSAPSFRTSCHTTTCAKFRRIFTRKPRPASV
jgi:hypothetical protein